MLPFSSACENCVAVIGLADFVGRNITESLLPFGIFVAEISSVTDFYKEFKNINPDAVIISADKEFPVSGFKSFMLQNSDEYIPVIALIESGLLTDIDFISQCGFDVCVPVPLDTDSFCRWVLGALNIKNRMNEIKQYECNELANNNIRKVREVYRDVILAVTQDKLRLILEPDELPARQEHLKVSEMSITEVEDLVVSKQMLEDCLIKSGWGKSRVFDVVVSVSEAISNVLKHAGRGTMIIYNLQDYYQVWVCDNGKGIEFSDIPKSALQKGHSSKNSLGMGFYIMMELADKLYLYTHTGGTVIVMDIFPEKQPTQPVICEAGFTSM